VKPILFTALADRLEPRPLESPTSWLMDVVVGPLTGRPGAPYRASGDALADTAVVIDLPGAEGALLGIALARHGFAPVPLYNGVWNKDLSDMWPIVDAPVDGVVSHHPDTYLPNSLGRRFTFGPAVIDMRPIVDALVDGAETVRKVPGGAQPAFLLDADRLGVTPGPSCRFDNRWFSVPTDFPSASTLWEAGLRRVVLIQRRDPWPAADLAPTLLSFQQRGLRLFLARVEGGAALAPLASVRPPWHIRLRHFLGRQDFQRRADGAFGIERIEHVC
jgi:hypothetical protein